MTIRDYWEVESETVVRWAKNHIINFLPDFWIINRCVRPAIGRMCGIKCAPGVTLQKPIFYGNAKNILIGDKSAIGRNVVLDGSGAVAVGKNVAIAFQVTFITGNHAIGPKQKRVGKLISKPIIIGDGVWIGARVTIGPGVEVGAGSVISAGSVLMRSVAPNSVVAGVPGRVVTRIVSMPDTDLESKASV